MMSLPFSRMALSWGFITGGRFGLFPLVDRLKGQRDDAADDVFARLVRALMYIAKAVSLQADRGPGCLMESCVCAFGRFRDVGTS